MARVVVPTCVIYSYSIIIPIAKWDLFEDIFSRDKNIDTSNPNQAYGIYQQI